MPSTYDPTAALPLRVPPTLREDLDALAASLPRGVTLARNSVAIAALRRGVDALRAELERDPLAVHRALAAAPDRDAGDTSGDRAPARAPKPSRPTPKPRPATAPKARAAPSDEPADAPDAATVRELLTTVLDRDRSVTPGAKGAPSRDLVALASRQSPTVKR